MGGCWCFFPELLRDSPWSGGRLWQVCHPAPLASCGLLSRRFAFEHQEHLVHCQAMAVFTIFSTRGPPFPALNWGAACKITHNLAGGARWLPGRAPYRPGQLRPRGRAQHPPPARPAPAGAGPGTAGTTGTAKAARGARHGAVHECLHGPGRYPAPQPAGQRAEVTAGAGGSPRACPPLGSGVAGSPISFLFTSFPCPRRPCEAPPCPGAAAPWERLPKGFSQHQPLQKTGRFFP